MFSCSDSDNVEENSNTLLPRVIITQFYSDDVPSYDHTLIRTFKYDNLNRPIEIVDEKIYENENTFRSSITKKIEYLGDDVILQTDIEKYATARNGYSTNIITRTYVLNAENSSIINITRNDNFSEMIELSNGLAIKYDGILLPSGTNFTKIYQYNSSNDISQYSYSTEKKYEYDNNVGVFKNMDIPQWFFVSLFDEIGGRTNNIEKIYSLNNGVLQNFGTNINEYNHVDYPVKIKFIPAEGLQGLSGRESTIEYINAAILTNY